MNQYHQTNKEEENERHGSVVLLYAQQKANGRKMVVERQPLNYGILLISDYIYMYVFYIYDPLISG